MKRALLTSLAMAVMSSLTYAGPAPISANEMREVVPPACPEWYAHNEWNVSLWGAYAFSGTNGTNALIDPFNLPGPVSTADISVSSDRYLETNDAWGGGIDLKYFWHRYFGFGVEGFILDANRTTRDVEINRGPGNGFTTRQESRPTGAVLGTFTLRYPIHCSRFAPYVFAGGGAIFGGGEQDILTINFSQEFIETRKSDTETKAICQFGAGFEVCLTPHIGWTNGFSWNVIDGAKNNFGMVRSGVTFAF